MNAIQCTVMRRRSELDEWTKYNVKSIVRISNESIMLQEHESSKTIANIPKQAVTKITSPFKNISQIHCIEETYQIAVRFVHVNDGELFRNAVIQYEFPCSDRENIQKDQDVEFSFPNLQDPLVKQFVLKLLISEEFGIFVKDLKNLLDDTNSN